MRRTFLLVSAYLLLSTPARGQEDQTITATPSKAVPGIEVRFVASVGRTDGELKEGWTIRWTINGEEQSAEASQNADAAGNADANGVYSVFTWTPTEAADYQIKAVLVAPPDTSGSDSSEDGDDDSTLPDWDSTVVLAVMSEAATEGDASGSEEGAAPDEEGADLDYTVVAGPTQTLSGPLSIEQPDAQGRYYADYSSDAAPENGDWLWTKASGPGTVSFEPGTDGTSTPIVYFHEEGDYALNCSYDVLDGEHDAGIDAQRYPTDAQSFIAAGQSGGGGGTGGGGGGDGGDGGGDENKTRMWVWRLSLFVPSTGYGNMGIGKTGIRQGLNSLKAYLRGLGVHLVLSNATPRVLRDTLKIDEKVHYLKTIKATGRTNRQAHATILRHLKTTYGAAGSMPVLFSDTGPAGIGLGTSNGATIHIGDIHEVKKEDEDRTMGDLTACALLHELLSHTYSGHSHPNDRHDGIRGWESDITRGFADFKDFAKKAELKVSAGVRAWLRIQVMRKGTDVPKGELE